MIKKVIPLTLLTLTLVASPAFAISEKANERAQEKSQGKRENVLPEVIVPTTLPTAVPTHTPLVTESDPLVVEVMSTPTVTPSPGKEKKVLGESRNKITANEVLENGECDPNAEYKNHGKYVSCVAHQRLGGQTVSAAARSDIGKKHSDITPTATPTATPPLTSPVMTAQINFNPIDTLSSLLDRVVGFFKHLV